MCHERQTRRSDDPGTVLRTLAALAADLDPSGCVVQLIQTAHAYLAARREQIRHPDYAAGRYSLGNGSVEGACTIVVDAYATSRDKYMEVLVRGAGGRRCAGQTGRAVPSGLRRGACCRRCACSPRDRRR